MSIKHLTDEQLQLYLDGGKSKENLLIEAHLNKCKDCLQQLEAYQLVFVELKTEPEEVFSLGFESVVIDKIHDKESKIIRIKNFFLYAAAIIFGAIISIYVLLSIQISESIEHIFVDKWVGAKYTYDYIFSISSDLNISIEVFISAGIILLFYGFFDRILMFSKNKKFSIFNGVKMFV